MSSKYISRGRKQRWTQYRSSPGYQSGKETVYTSGLSYFDYIISSPRIKTPRHTESDVYHWHTVKPFSGLIRPSTPNGYDRVDNYPADPGHCLLAIEEARRLANRLTIADVFEDFSGIEFIKELPKSLSLFNPASYFSKSGYGQYKWGFTPFINDVKSLSTALSDLSRTYRTGVYSKRVHKSKPVEVACYPTHPNPELRSLNFQKFTGTARFQADVIVSAPSGVSDSLHRVSLALDALQINPDLLTAWELAPFSFVVDYFLPVSDILKQLTPRGWGPYNVDYIGSWSLKGKYTFTTPINTLYGDEKFISATAAEGSFYERKYTTGRNVTVGKSNSEFTQDLKFFSPSNQNVLDTAYIAAQTLLKRKNKKR